MKLHRSWSKIVGCLVLIAVARSGYAASGPQSLSLGGQLFAADGSAITSPSVNFRVQVYDASETCVLYSEEHLGENLATSTGHFNLILGTGTSKTNNVGAAGVLDGKVFANGGATTVAGCAASPLNLAAGQERQIHVLYDLGSGYVTMTPAVPLVSSAYAMVADSLNGLAATDFIQINGTSALNQANEEYAFSLTNWPRLKALLDGTSSQYLPSSPTVPLDVNGQRITHVADPVAAQDAASKHYVDTNLGGSALDLTAVGPMTGAGSTLLWDATANKWVAGTLATTPTGAAGGDLTGTYPNPTIKNDVITAAKIKSAGVGVNRLIITDATTGASLGYGECTTAGQVFAWTATGWACTNVSTLAPVTSVAGKTGVITLNAADVGGLGTAALFDWGTAANQIVRLDGAAKLPALDGSQLLNVNATLLQGRGVASLAPTPGQVLGWNGTAWTPVGVATGSVSNIASGTGLLGGPITSTGTLSVDVGTTANKILQLNASAQVPAVDGSLLTGVNAVKLQSRAVSASAPAAGQVLAWNAAAAEWAPVSAATGSVTGIATTNGILGGPITGTGTLSLDTGTSANKILQLNASAQIPSVDGSLLTQVNAVRLQTRAVAATAPTAGQVLSWNASSTQWEPTNGAAGNVTGFATGVGLLGGPITTTGTLSVDVGATANKIVQENVNAQIAQGLGTAALPSYAFTGNTNTGLFSPGANQLALSTNGTAALNVFANGYVGINTNSAAAPLEVAGSIRMDGDYSKRFTLDPGSGLNRSYLFNAFGGTFLTRNLVHNGSSLVFDYGYNAGAALALDANGASIIVAPSAASATATTALFVQNTGLVGIGTTAPQAGLDLALTGTAASAVLLPRDTTGNRPGGVNGMLRYNTSSNVFEGFANGLWSTIAAGSAAGTVTNIASGSGLLGGPITASGTLSVDVGTGANKIPQLNANAQLALANGGFTAPTYAFAAYPKTGFFASDVNQVSLAISGTAAFTVAADLTAAFASNLTLFQNRGADLTLNVQNPVAGYAANVQTNAQSYYSNMDFNAVVGGVGTGWRIGMNGDQRFGVSQNSTTFPLLIEKNAPSYQIYLQASGRVGVGTVTPVSALDVFALGTSSSALVVPRDTTANRPGGVNGMLRYNTTSNGFEGFANGVWATIAAGTSAGTVKNVASGTGLLGGPITNVGTLSVDVGTAAGKIVQENADAQIAQGPGSVALPSFAFATSPKTGLFSPGTNQISLSSNGTAALSVLANGNVGVGSTAPTTRLQVGGGDLAIDTGRALRLDGASSSVWSLGLNQTAYPKTLATSSSIDVVTSGNDYEGFTIGKSGASFYEVASAPGFNIRHFFRGSVGIGTTAPAAGLDIATTGTAGSALIVPRDTTANRPGGVNGMIRYNSDTNAFEGFAGGAWGGLAAGPGVGVWATNSPDVYYTAGKVGIGTNAPTFPLDVAGGVLVEGTSALNLSSTNFNLRSDGVSLMVNSWSNLILSGDTDASGGEGVLVQASTIPSLLVTAGKVSVGHGNAAALTLSIGDHDTGIDHPADGALVVNTNGTPRMSFDSGGNIGIGTTAMDHVLDVWGVNTNNKLAAITDTTASAQDVGGSLELKGLDGSSDRAFATIKGGKQNGTSGNYDGYFAVLTRSYADNGDTEKFRVTAQGLVGIGTTAPSAPLDVNGNVRVGGQIYTKTQTISGGTSTVDWSGGNAISTDYGCAANFSFANLRDGGTYTLVVTNTGTTQCNFGTTTTGGDAATVTYRFKPLNSARTASSHTLYTLMRVGTIVYVSWSSGF